MSVRTIDELADRLDEGMAWRRVELQALKAAITDAERLSPGSPLSRALARSGITMLYAHWEGYVKDSCTAYVEFIARRRLRCDELSDGLLRTVLESLGRRAVAGDEQALSDLVDAIRRPGNARARIPKLSMIDTKSNLRFKVLCEILSQMGFSAEDFFTKDKLIDVSLCDQRNSIAHGRENFPVPGDYTTLLSEVFEMMEHVGDVIMAGARLRSYRRPELAPQA